MKKVIKALKITGVVLLSLIVLFAAFLGVTTLKQVSRENTDPETAVNTTGLVQAVGSSLYDADGKLLRLRGVNVGGGLVTEGWIVPYSCGPDYNEDGSVKTDADGNVQYPDLTTDQAIAGIKSNPNLSDAQIKQLKQIYLENWFSEEDFRICSRDLKFNCLRLPFSWHDILNDDYSRKDETEAFSYFDWFLSMCKKYDMYCILDLHCATKTQSGYEHSGSDSHDLLWDDEDQINNTCDLWKYIAEHYNKPAYSDLGKYIASYDLINEPTGDYRSKTTDKVYPVFDKIYRAIRSTGDQHNITMCFTWQYDAFIDPAVYGWENIQYQIHIYNWWSSYLPNWLLYDAYEITNWLHEWNVPYLVGEFTFFEDNDAWNTYLAQYDKRGYSWTLWTYKKNVTGWWNDSWGIYNQKLNLEPGTMKVDLRTATFNELKTAFENTSTTQCEKSTTYETLYNYMNK